MAIELEVANGSDVALGDVVDRAVERGGFVKTLDQASNAHRSTAIAISATPIPGESCQFHNRPCHRRPSFETCAAGEDSDRAIWLLVPDPFSDFDLFQHASIIDVIQPRQVVGVDLWVDMKDAFYVKRS